jgi:deferrochelatase/peroxidase EfeB
VVGFWKFIAEQADQDPALAAMTPAERRVWFAAKVVGRWPSGAPTVKYPDKDQPDLPKAELNNFYYHDRDYDGYKTPRGSHIRRANPRDTNGTNPASALKTSDSHLLIRRGMSYGSPLVSPDEMPPQNLVEDHQDRGLIFLAINADISRQFEFVHQSWLNNTKFDRLYSDKDPVVGDHCDDTEPDGKQYDFNIHRDPVRRRVRDIPRFVTVKGGGYFFMPSISTLKLLSQL